MQPCRMGVFVGHHLVGCKALLLEQGAHQFERGLFVSAGLNQDIENLTHPVHCPPELRDCGSIT